MSNLPNLLFSTLDKLVNADGTASMAFRTKWQQAVAPDPFTVASLPDNARIGTRIYATDLRVFNGAGTQETAGNGTGGSVEWNGTAWKIVGTNVTAVA